MVEFRTHVGEVVNANKLKLFIFYSPKNSRGHWKWGKGKAFYGEYCIGKTLGWRKEKDGRCIESSQIESGRNRKHISGLV